MDIVEKLREKTKSLEWLQKMGGSDKHVLFIMKDAANEIERLREEVRQLEEIMDEEKCASVYLATKSVLKKHGYW